ncbi:MAG: zf-HC2 domain-containing protein, partial [Deltaproteobacteria bacterium]|nr:zf-HC2 domain-containing protein [Deltaproteobacteria bacterium]
MECALIQERLSEYIDGTLDANDRTAVENHISSCKSCKEDLSSLIEMVEELHAMDPVEAPADFLEKIHERMDSRFSLDRIIRKLFIPFRIKIPLELA